MKNKVKKIFDKLAVKNGYRDRYELLMDYDFIPAVLTPKHNKIEIIGLLLNRNK